jgi:hypothetical protein
MLAHFSILRAFLEWRFSAVKMYTCLCGMQSQKTYEDKMNDNLEEKSPRI